MRAGKKELWLKWPHQKEAVEKHSPQGHRCHMDAGPRDAELVEATQSRLKAERQRLESQVAQAMVTMHKAEQRIEFLETERLADRQRAAEHAKARREQREQWRRELHKKIAEASADGGVEGEDEALRLAQMAVSEEDGCLYDFVQWRFGGKLLIQLTA